MENHTHHSRSFIERLDPRVKFSSSILLAIQIFGITGELPLISASVVLIVASISARIPFRVHLKRLLSVSVFLLVILGLNMFTVSGDVVFELFGMYATREGLYQGAILSIRIVLMLIAATLVVRTTPISIMIDGIEATLRPVRRRLGAIVQVLTIALSFTPMLIQSARQIKKAQIARGAEPDKNIARQIQFAFSAAVPLFAMTLRSSDHLAQAMEARCYDPMAERSLYSRLTLTLQDWVTAVMILMQFVLTLAFRSGTSNHFTWIQV